MATLKELEIIRLSRVRDANNIVNLKKIEQITPLSNTDQISEREKLLNKYASKINVKNNASKPILPIQKINNFFNDNQNEDADIIKITFKLYQKVNNKITDKNFKKVINIIYYGPPEDSRSNKEKHEDEFVVFLTNEIKLITDDKDQYYKMKSDIIESILSLKKANKTKNSQGKTSIFQIWLQLIKFDILGSEDNVRDFSKREAEQKSSIGFL